MTSARPEASKGRTIQVYLPTGEPRAIRIAHMFNRDVRAVAYPRHRLEEAFKRTELNAPSLYLLLGRDESDTPIAYVGESEEGIKRISDHHKKEHLGWWQDTVQVISAAHAFTKSHIRMLEYLAIAASSSAGRYRLANSNKGIEPHLTEAMHSEVLEILETTELLIATLGYPIFDKLPTRAAPRAENAAIFHATGDGYDAMGRYDDGEFIVLAGSIARAAVTESAREWLPARRSLLQREGKIELTPQGLRFTVDVVFNSPSAAAAMIKGRSSNGWDAWTLPDGTTLSDVYRPSTTDIATPGANSTDDTCQATLPQ